MFGVWGRVAWSAAAGSESASSPRARTPGTSMRNRSRIANLPCRNEQGAHPQPRNPPCGMPRRRARLQLGLRVEGRELLGPCSGLGDEQAVEAAEQAVAVDEAVVAVGRPQALGVDRLQRREVVVGDLAGLGGRGEVDYRDTAAVPRG